MYILCIPQSLAKKTLFWLLFYTFVYTCTTANFDIFFTVLDRKGQDWKVSKGGLFEICKTFPKRWNMFKIEKGFCLVIKFFTKCSKFHLSYNSKILAIYLVDYWSEYSHLRLSSACSAMCRFFKERFFYFMSRTANSALFHRIVIFLSFPHNFNAFFIHKHYFNNDYHWV